MASSEVHVSYKNRGNIEVIFSFQYYILCRETSLTLVNEKYTVPLRYSSVLPVPISTLEWLGNEFRGVNRDLDRCTKARHNCDTAKQTTMTKQHVSFNKTLIYTSCFTNYTRWYFHLVSSSMRVSL